MRRRSATRTSKTKQGQREEATRGGNDPKKSQRYDSPANTNFNTIMKEGFVLYVDHARHPAPLSLCYHATGARRLSSAVDRYPPATLTEVDSAYCPQCLSYHDASSAARLGTCDSTPVARHGHAKELLCSIGKENLLFSA